MSPNISQRKKAAGKIKNMTTSSNIAIRYRKKPSGAREAYAGSGPDAAGTHRQSEEQKENENENETAFGAACAIVFICEKVKYSEEKKKCKHVAQAPPETHGYPPIPSTISAFGSKIKTENGTALPTPPIFSFSGEGCKPAR